MARRHVLIGAGPASVSAAEAVRAMDPGAEIVAVSEEPDGYYSRPGLAYHLAREIPESALFPFSRGDLDRLGVRMVTQRVAAIDRAARGVVLADGARLPYDRLLLATGSRATPLGVRGAELDGVVKLDDLTDARGLIRRSASAKAAVVVGGGITALEIAEGLCARRVHVHYLMRRDRYWSNVLSETESRIVEDGLAARGVEVHHFTEIAGIEGNLGRVSAVWTVDGRRIPADLVAVAIGVHPRCELAKGAGLECARGVLVDRYLRSSDEAVYAAGDVAEVTDELTGRRTIEVLWNAAIAKGRIAGANMAAEPVHAYAEGVPLNVTRLAGFKITIIGTVGSGGDSDLAGLARGDSETWRRLGTATVVEGQAGDAHIRLALADRTIAGAVVMGGQALSFPLQDLIAAGADVGGVIPQLTAPGAPLAELVAECWRDWRSHHA
jgi:NAD(P)H-nitrite reductase large subunit